MKKKIYIYIGLRWPPAATYNCAQVHHRSPAGTVTRVQGRCLHWSPTPPGPRWPPAYRCILIEVLHLYRCVTHTHLTHNLSPHTVLTHNLLTHRFLVAHTTPSPSLFSFLHFPCHLYLSFAACWKNLTWGYPVPRRSSVHPWQGTDKFDGKPNIPTHWRTRNSI